MLALNTVRSHLKPVCVCVCVCFQKADSDPEDIRKEMELQLEAWHKLTPGSQEEVILTRLLFHVL